MIRTHREPARNRKRPASPRPATRLDRRREKLMRQAETVAAGNGHTLGPWLLYTRRMHGCASAGYHRLKSGYPRQCALASCRECRGGQIVVDAAAGRITGSGVRYPCNPPPRPHHPPQGPWLGVRQSRRKQRRAR